MLLKATGDYRLEANPLELGNESGQHHAWVVTRQGDVLGFGKGGTRPWAIMKAVNDATYRGRVPMTDELAIFLRECKEWAKRMPRESTPGELATAANANSGQ